jgi:glycine dehydrogenase subunit 2
LDEFIAVMRTLAEEAIASPEYFKEAPHNTPVGRLDETTAARQPILRYRDLQ